MIITPLLCLALAAFAGYYIYFYLLKRPRFPPGPTPWPLIGNSIQFFRSKNIEKTAQDWAQKYGPITSIWGATAPLISVNTYEKCVEWFVKNGDLFTSRYSLKIVDEATRGGTYGVITTSGDLWKEQRRFALKTLRDFGLGKSKMEQRMLVEISNLFAKVDKAINTDNEVEFHKFTDLAVGSVINVMISGYSYTEDESREEEYLKVKAILNSIPKAFTSPFALLCLVIPPLRHLPIFKNAYDNAMGTFKELFSYLEKVFDEHEKTNDYSTMDEPHDFMDAYCIEWRRREAEKEATGVEHFYSRPQMLSTCLDFWMAGMETTTSTLNWGVALLINYPEVQYRLQRELDAVIGDRIITMSDRPNLHYTMAVVTELQRFANIIPLNLNRIPDHDIVLDGYKIPKGTLVYPQISAVMWDPAIFKDPTVFRPTRFLDANGKFCPKEEVIPFSLGRRQCPGEGLARMEIFLFMANLFNRYSFSTGKTPVEIARDYNSLNATGMNKYSCVVERRTPTAQ